MPLAHATPRVSARVCSINLYAAVAALGLAGATGYVDLPASLAVVQDPLVIRVAVVMYCIEFLADKTPGVDTAWGAAHTFVRIPAGALLAAGAVGEVTPALSIAAALAGGTISAATHATKAGTRVLVNTSPEPFSNWAASVGEDVATLGGIWLALQHPVAFLAAFAAFVLLLVWALPRLANGVRALARRIGGWLGMVQPDPATAAQALRTAQLADLDRLHDSGVLSAAEHRAARVRLGARE